jgi:hypothetical protein
MASLQFTPSEKRVVLTLLSQHWENARHIKNERLSFTNIYCLVVAGILGLLHSVRGEMLMEASLLIFLISFSIIGLLTSLRLKAELEYCLRHVENIVEQLSMQSLMPPVDGAGTKIRYPKFRWLFPTFYSIAIAGFVFILLARVHGGFQ